MRNKIILRKSLALVLTLLMLMSCVVATPIMGVSAAEDNEAAINGTEYATLADAVTAATAGDTIKLLKDIELKAQLTISKAITLDGDAHTIYVANDTDLRKSLYFIKTEASFTMKNTTFCGQPMSDPDGTHKFAIGSTSDKTGAFYLTGGDTKQVFENCKITGFYCEGGSIFAYMTDPLTTGYTVVDGVQVPTDAGVYLIDTTITGNSSDLSGGNGMIMRTRSGSGIKPTDCATPIYVDGNTVIENNLDGASVEMGIQIRRQGDKDNPNYLYAVTRVIVKEGFTGYVRTRGTVFEPAYDEDGNVTKASHVQFEGNWTGKGLVEAVGQGYAYPAPKGQAYFTRKVEKVENEEGKEVDEVTSFAYAYVYGITDAEGNMTWAANNDYKTVMNALPDYSAPVAAPEDEAAKNIVVQLKDVSGGVTWQGTAGLSYFTYEGHGHKVTRTAKADPFARVNYTLTHTGPATSYVIYNDFTFDGGVHRTDNNGNAADAIVTFDKSYFEANQGAAFGMESGTMVLNNVTIENVAQTRTSSANTDRSPIYLKNGAILKATNLTVKNCYSMQKNGAAITPISATGNVYLAGNCTFENNYSIKYDSTNKCHKMVARGDVAHHSDSAVNLYFEAGYTSETPLVVNNRNDKDDIVAYAAEGVSSDVLTNPNPATSSLTANRIGAANEDGYTSLVWGNAVYSVTFTVKDSENNEVVSFVAQLEDGVALPTLGCVWNGDENLTTFNKAVTSYVGVLGENVKAIADADSDGIFDSYSNDPATLIAAGGHIELLADFTPTAQITMTKSTYIDGNGYTITRAAGTTGVLIEVKKVDTFESITFTNVNFNGGNIEAESSFINVVSNKLGQTIIFDNCQVTGCKSSAYASFLLVTGVYDVYLKDVIVTGSSAAQGVIRAGYYNGTEIGFTRFWLAGGTKIFNDTGETTNIIYGNGATLSVSEDFTGHVEYSPKNGTNETEGTAIQRPTPADPTKEFVLPAEVAEGAKITGTIKHASKELYAYNNKGVLTWGVKGATMCEFDHGDGEVIMENRAYAAGDKLPTPFKVVDKVLYAGHWEDENGTSVDVVTAGVSTYKAVYDAEASTTIEAYVLGVACGDLVDVVANAADGATVEVLRDVYAAKTITVTTNLTINGNSHFVAFGNTQRNEKNERVGSFDGTHLMEIKTQGITVAINDLTFEGGAAVENKWDASDEVRSNSHLVHYSTTGMTITYTNCTFTGHRTKMVEESNGLVMNPNGCYVHFRGNTEITDNISWGMCTPGSENCKKAGHIVDNVIQSPDFRQAHGGCALRNNKGHLITFEGKVILTDNFTVSGVTKTTEGEGEVILPGSYAKANYQAGGGDASARGYQRTAIVGKGLEAGSQFDWTTNEGFLLTEGAVIAPGAFVGDVIYKVSDVIEGLEAGFTATDGKTIGAKYGVADSASANTDNMHQDGNLNTDKFVWNLMNVAVKVGYDTGRVEVEIGGDRSRTLVYPISDFTFTATDAAGVTAGTLINGGTGYINIPVELYYAELAVDVTVKIYDGNTRVTTIEAKGGAKAKYLDPLAQNRPEYEATVEAIKSFGGYLQTFAGVNLGKLPNADEEGNIPTDDVVQTMVVNIAGNQASASGGVANGLSVSNVSVVLRDGFNIRYYISGDTTGATFKVGDKELELVTKGENTYVELANIPVRKLAEIFTLEMTNSTGTATFGFGVMVYVKQILAMEGESMVKAQNACKALFHFYKAVAEQFVFDEYAESGVFNEGKFSEAVGTIGSINGLRVASDTVTNMGSFAAAANG